MLQFIFGRASSGKTETIYNLAAMENIDDTLIIVPEQYTFETEKNLLKKGKQGISVLSFSRLVDTTKNIYGGVAGDTLSNFDKVIVMLRALNNVKDFLTVYKKYYDSIEFANKLLSLNNEFKEMCVSLDELSNKLEAISAAPTKSKLKDIITIFLEYESIISKEFLDPADELKRLYDVINKNNFFKDKSIFFDGFKSFTNAQLKIVKCALRDARKVVISFCCDIDALSERKSATFTNVYKIIDKILNTANDVGCEIEKPILLKDNYYKNEELRFFEKHLFDYDGSIYDEATSNIGILHSNSSAEMIDNVLILIHRLVRTEGYRYGDFIIVARDINKYDRYISVLSEKYDIPVFFDKRKSLKYSPISRAVLGAVEAAVSFKSDTILDYLKSGLNIISENELVALSDYVYLWNINGPSWNNEWNMSVKGLEPYKNDFEKEECLKTLDTINNIREKVIKPIVNLKNRLSNSPTKNCEAIYEFIKEVNVRDLFSEYVSYLEKNNNFVEFNYCKSSYEALMEVLSSMHKCFKNYEINPQKFLELLRHAIINKTVGVLPQMIDEVSCGSADRIRPAQPKVAFVIGLNQYEFPASVGDSDLLLNSDRKILIDLNIDIVDKLETYLQNENHLIYTTTCCANEKVFLCSCSNGGDNTPSSIISTVKAAFPKVNNIDLSGLEEKIETTKNSFSILAEMGALNDENYSTLYKCFVNSDYEEKLQFLQSTLELNNAKLSDGFANEHFNKDFNMSASRIDSFYKCKFNYFCKYILYLGKKKPAEIDVLNRGTIVHYVLEHTVKKYGKKLAELSYNELDLIVDTYLNEYIELMEATELLKDSRFKYIFNKISFLTQKTIHRISEEFKYTEFEPAFCECNIGEDVPPLVIKGQNDITITGFIDRVDIYKGDKNYIRVVDYKSGNMKININNILYGLNLQMLIYLYAFVKNDKNYNAIPAGVFYLPVNGGYNKDNPNMRMSGVLPSESELYSALDSSGEYIPKLARDGGRKDNPQINLEDFNTLFGYIEHKVKEMESSILNGDFEVAPIGGNNGGACQYCDFKAICRLENSDKIRNVDTTLNTVEALEFMRGINHEI